MKIRKLKFFGWELYRSATIKEKILDIISSYAPDKRTWEEKETKNQVKWVVTLGIVYDNYKTRFKHEISFNDFFSFIWELSAEGKILIDERKGNNPFALKQWYFVIKR